MSRKLVVNDGRTERELLLVGTMVVGRDPTCDISDADPLLSRRHVEFVTGAKEIVVRDLGSRNGILINGVKMAQGILRGGDIVQVGHLQVKFVEDGAPLVAPSDPNDDADATVMAGPPASRPAAALPPPSRSAATPTIRAASPADMATRIVPARVGRGGIPEDFDKTMPTIRKTDLPPSTPKPGGNADFDRTIPTIRKSDLPPAPPNPAAAQPAATQPEARAAVPAPEPAETDDPDKTRFVPPPVMTPPSRPALIRPAAAPSAVPPPQPGVRNAPPVRTAPETDTAAAQATARVARHPWTFLVLIQILALAAVVFLGTALPLILWPLATGNGAVVLVLPIIIVLVAAWSTSRLINRQTLRALTALTEDIELAVGGKLDAIGDPLGAKPVRDLADAVNHLIARLRAAGSGDSAARPNLGSVRAQQNHPSPARPSPARSEAAAAAAAPQIEASRARREIVEARIVANAHYRITDASPGCADLVGARPDALVGHHLIDAMPDREVADAVLRCLSALGASGEQRTSVQPAGRAYRLSIVVSREGRDRPLTIVLAADRTASV